MALAGELACTGVTPDRFAASGVCNPKRICALEEKFAPLMETAVPPELGPSAGKAVGALAREGAGRESMPGEETSIAPRPRLRRPHASCESSISSMAVGIPCTARSEKIG